MAVGEEPLIVQSGLFEYKNRPRRDTWAAIVWVLLLVGVVVGGIYSATHRNTQFSRLVQPDYLADGKHCPMRRSLLERAPLEQQEEDLADFFKHASKWLLFSALGCLVLGLVFLWLFKNHAKPMVRATIRVQVALPVVAGIVLLATGQFTPGLVALLIGALSAFCFWLWRNEIDLCARLLTVAAHGLHANPGLLVFVTGAKATLIGFIVPVFAFTYLAITNGQVAPNGARGGRQECVNSEGAQVPCCQWQPDSWVPAYATLNSIAFLWTTFLIFELRVYVIAGTICQWYFMAPSNQTSTKGFTLRSLRLGLTSSFGSLCFGSAILTAVQMARNAMENARQQRGGNILLCLVACLMECFMQVIEYITKFATMRAAFTGEAFLTAGRSVTDLLKRNFLKAYGVWWFPPLVLNLASFLLSAVWGLSVFAMSYASWHKNTNGLQESIILGVMCFVMALIVLAFFASVLLNVVDAVFLCYAMDKDTQAVTKPEVHEVFSLLPVGVIVEQPGGSGEVAYGAPVHYVPPASPMAQHAPQQAPHPPSTHYDSSAPV
ncbi:hypothetical protein WJX72_008466 [[Myrmecia] bisecta]|uniref:Choline transporter-like protein n=1 Tax=[Myrmecia] bisecta TaxID=41462 RepID=A0AAW1R8C9_9CHLO